MTNEHITELKNILNEYCIEEVLMQISSYCQSRFFWREDSIYGIAADKLYSLTKQIESDRVVE